MHEVAGLRVLHADVDARTEATALLIMHPTRIVTTRTARTQKCVQRQPSITLGGRSPEKLQKVFIIAANACSLKNEAPFDSCMG
eukprot:1438545-Amphidinium_carterae.1